MCLGSSRFLRFSRPATTASPNDLTAGRRELFLAQMAKVPGGSVGRPMGLSAKEALNNTYLVGQQEAEGYADQPGYHREALTEAFKAMSHEAKGRGDSHRE